MTDRSNQHPTTRRPFIAAAIVIAVLALCTVIAISTNLLTGSSSSQSHAGATSTSSGGSRSSSSTTAAAAGDPDPSVCGRPGYTTTGTLDTAPTVKWTLVGTVAAPNDPNGAGPGVSQSDGFRYCFAHTPTGALYAATNIVALQTNQTLLKQAVEKLVVPGAGQDALRRQVEAQAPTNARYQVAGFKVDRYTAVQATVDLALNLSGGQLLSVPYLLRWSGGDWKAVATDAGQYPLQPAQLQNLGGYVPWSGA